MLTPNQPDDRRGASMARVAWKNSPDAHDYPAAADYLSLLGADADVRADLIARWQDAAIAHYKAKDLLRASQLALLSQDNLHVAADLRKIRKGRALSPLLLVRGDLLHGFPLQIADGYHRVCASYYVDENTDIPCRLIDIPRDAAGRAPAPKSVLRDAGEPPIEPSGGEPATVPAKKVAKKVAAKKVATKVAKKVAVKNAPAKVAKKVAVKNAPAKKVAKKAPAVPTAPESAPATT
jgi:hypothetical protein